jgi:hypothetical protein
MCNVRCVTIRIEVNNNIVIVAFESRRKCEMKLGITSSIFSVHESPFHDSMFFQAKKPLSLE